MELNSLIITELSKDNRTYFENILNYANPLYSEVCQDLHSILVSQLSYILDNEF